MQLLDRSVLTSRYELSDASLVSDALVVQSSDPRYQEAFAQATKDLGIRYPIVMSIPGGINDLASPSSVISATNLWKQMAQLAKEHRIKRVVIFHNADCPNYGKLTKLAAKFGGNGTSKILEGLEKLAEKHLKIAVELYIAQPHGNEATFERMDAI